MPGFARLQIVSIMEKVVFGFSDLPGFEIGNRSLPGVIVIQEWWGVTQNIIEIAEQIHAAGFRCLIPDLCELFSTAALRNNLPTAV